MHTLGLPDYNNTDREYVDEDEDLVTNVIGHRYGCHFSLCRKPLRRHEIYREAFEELKREKDTGYIMITYGLNFDDLAEQFKMERYQQISVPIHQVTLFARSDVRGVVKGSLLARSHLQSIFTQHRSKLMANN